MHHSSGMCQLQEADKLRQLAEEDRAAALVERDEALAAKEAAERERQEVRARGVAAPRLQGRYMLAARRHRVPLLCSSDVLDHRTPPPLLCPDRQLTSGTASWL